MSNMFDNRPNETQYFYTDNDASGTPLDGSKTYAITFPAGQEPPVNGFWSLTLYNQYHFFSPNVLKRYSLGTKNKELKRNPVLEGIEGADRGGRHRVALADRDMHRSI